MHSMLITMIVLVTINSDQYRHNMYFEVMQTDLLNRLYMVLSLCRLKVASEAQLLQKFVRYSQ